MLFCLYVDQTGRAILGHGLLADVLALIEAKDWQEARRAVDGNQAMDAFSYRAGWGWFKRKG
ncbi:hypothetical protein D0839_17305 [Bordetella avium]|nr:hypothetical protein D0839_17305 [Bordetella avium]UOK17467.1 hypothetical protein vBBaMIFTN8_02 [Bordetella phage vB_BaM-IFTN8]